MSFVKTTWRNGASPAITAEQLNRIEKGIEDSYNGEGITSATIIQKLGFTPANNETVEQNTQNINRLNTSVENLDTSVANLNTSVQTINSSITTLNTNVAALQEKADELNIIAATVTEDGDIEFELFS